MTGDVTGLELAEVCQQSYMSVTGHNTVYVGLMSADFRLGDVKVYIRGGRFPIGDP